MISFQVAQLKKKYLVEIFLFFLILFVTPTQIETSSADLAPSIFTFFYNILFEQNFSIRVLRPVFLSLPLAIIFIFIFWFFKRKFF
tara:strand:- start:224 stop:481 length:258 start_codon:yes stop_codon:yes gene_type:complete